MMEVLASDATGVAILLFSIVALYNAVGTFDYVNHGNDAPEECRAPFR